MTHSIKLALLTVALGAAFSAQAASDPSATLWSRDIPIHVVNSTYSPGPLLDELTTTFGNAENGGTLHSAVYGSSGRYWAQDQWCCNVTTGQWISWASFDVYYQITNNATSLNPITSISQWVLNEDWRPGQAEGYVAPQGAWTSQIDGAFGTFSAGTVAADRATGQLAFGSNDGVYLDNSTTAWFDGLGIAPGATSYAGIASATGLGESAYYRLGTLNIGGHQVAAFVSTVPEPESYAMLLAGLGVIGGIVRRRKAKQA